MGNIVAIVSVLLALIAAGSIAYIAWELTSDEHETSESKDRGPEEDEP